MVRITYFKNGWIPVGVTGRGGTQKKNNGGGASGVSIIGSVDKKNGKKDRELRRKGRGILSHSVSAPTINPMRPHVHPPEVSATVSLKVVNPKSIDHEHKQHHHHHNPKAKKSVCKVHVSVDNRSSRSGKSVERSDDLYENPRPAIGYNASVDALTVVIITLFCLVFYGWLCAFFFTSVWCYLLPIFAEQLEEIKEMNGKSKNNSNIMVDLQSSEYRKKVMMDGLVQMKNNL